MTIFIAFLGGISATVLLMAVCLMLRPLRDSTSLREDDEIPDHWKGDLDSTPVVPVDSTELSTLRLVRNEMGRVE